MTWRVLVHVVAPIVIGATIYVLFRDTTLTVFRWIEMLGLTDYVHVLRSAVAGARWAPHAVVVTLPDGLWVYAGTAWMCSIWKWTVNAWTLLPASIGVFSELGQLCGLVPGTFDVADLVLVSVAGPVAWYASKAHDHENAGLTTPRIRNRTNGASRSRHGQQ